jgi:UDP-N-acetylglucosamine 1-carboxyvinyltransferase
MEKLVIEGGTRLEGSVRVSGAKNAILPILAGCLLAKGKSVIRNVPKLTDVQTMVELLQSLGCQATWHGDHRLEVETGETESCEAPLEAVRKMRASFYVLAPLLTRYAEASVPLPGGCVLGVRPVDLHLKALRALGADVTIHGGNVIAHAPGGLQGAEIFLGGHFGSSVGATVQVILAAVLAKGRTIVHCAACEPEVTDLANFLNLMGAKILGVGSPRLEIEGVQELRGVDYFVIPDRIEAATLMMAGIITRGEVEVQDVRPGHLSAVLDTFREMKAPFEVTERSIRIRNGTTLHSVDISTHPYPGFPTDDQPQMMSVLTTVEGASILTEHIYPDRFMHVAELNRLGADVRKHSSHAIVTGRRPLSGAEVTATDLRAGAALVLAGLVAEGKTELDHIEHLDRGYEKFESKLQSLGAKIHRESSGS